MKTTIVCGVLGAGKTTFLQNVLKDSPEKAVVLVNDFGSAGIDGDILSSGGIDTVELPSGCVCCTLKFDLISSIQQIVSRHRPDHLYIEPSGIASPGGVTEVLDMLRISPYTVVGIIDATEFLEALEQDMYGWFFKSQVTRSDILIVNKTDLVNEEKTHATIDAVTRMNPLAVVVPAVGARIDRALIPEGPGSSSGMPDEHPHDIGVDTVTLRIRGMKDEQLRRLFEEMASGKYGNVLRAKALMMTEEGGRRADLASGQVRIEDYDGTIEEGRIVVIGTELDRQALGRFG